MTIRNPGGDRPDTGMVHTAGRPDTMLVGPSSLVGPSIAKDLEAGNGARHRR